MTGVVALPVTTLHAPQREDPEMPVLLAIPGGGVTQECWTGPGSLAEAAGVAGAWLVTVDPPGAGRSLLPEQPDRLDPRRHAALVDQALRARLAADLPGRSAVLVGHSAGAMLSVLAHVQDPWHVGLAALGFSTAGLPQYLPDDWRTRPLEELAQQCFGTELVRARAEGAHATTFVATVAVLAMLPGNVSDEVARVAVSVLLAHGTRDVLIPDPRQAVQEWPTSAGVEHVVVEAGHQGLLTAGPPLYDRLLDWARRTAGGAR